MPRDKQQDKKIEDILSSTQDEAQQIDQIAKVRDWFGPKDDSCYYAAVQSYLQGQSNLEKTIQTITQPIDEALRTDKADSIDWIDLWYSIIHSAKRISYHDISSHSKLVELVKAIKEHPDPQTKSDQPVYKNLPEFGLARREAFNDGPRSGAGFTAPEISAWAKLNYFFARLTYEGVADVSLFAIWALREALEEEFTDDDPELPTVVQMVDAHAPAAAMWVFGLGRKLYEREEDLTPKSRKEGNPARGGAYWKGGAEFSKGRWALWKKRFGELAGVEGVKDGTKQLARDAVEAMEKAEKE
jgi:hypothetical protein